MEAIESVARQTRTPYAISLVWNGVPYEQFEKEREGMPRTGCWWDFNYLEEGNVSAARNLGFTVGEKWKGSADFVVPLDEDDILHPEYLERMEKAASYMPDHGIFYPDWAKMEGGYVSTPEYSFEELKEHPFIVSCSFISVDVWKQVGGYDEELVKQGLRWEDYLFYLKAGAMGVRMARVAPGALVKVRGGGEGSKIANSTLTAWYDYANKALEPLQCQLQPPMSSQ